MKVTINHFRQGKILQGAQRVDKELQELNQAKEAPHSLHAICETSKYILPRESPHLTQ
jgi:hypothetical protein